ncbi:MAG: hypothetical protein J5I93_04000 [Pirellulaceae bacterium]|nr:hypothetical protein [Pirellulaceae bacterium]
MSDEMENLKIDKDTYVNQATLELLQRRIESNVRNNFVKTVTLPIGGTSVVAVIVAVFLWIPQQVRSFLEQPSVQQTVQDEIDKRITKHFDQPKTQSLIDAMIQKQTSDQIAAQLEARLPDKVADAVNDYLGSERGQRLVEQNLPAAVQQYFAQDGAQENFRHLVDGYLNSEQGKQVIVAELDRLLRPAAERVSQDISDNLERYVAEFEAQSLHGEPKESVGKLEQFLRPENVAELTRRGQPIVLTKTIRPGNRYVASVIEDYLSGFSNAFPKLFQYVSISYAGDGMAGERLVALIPVRQFAWVLQREPAVIEDLLNSGDQPSRPTLEQVNAQLAALFGDAVVRRIPADRPVGSVLKDPTLWAPAVLLGADPAQRERITQVDPLEYPFAVVNDQGGLLAVASRRRMLEGLLKPADAPGP